MTSSSTSNPLYATLSTATHRSMLTSARPSLHRSRTSRAARRNRHARVQPASAVDVNNNTNMTVPSNILRATTNNSQILDRVAILKAFTSSNASQIPDSTMSPLCSNQTSTQRSSSKYEKPSTFREARKARKHGTHRYEPAIQQEFIRLRDTVPSIAGSNVSDLTIINEAISLICDLETQLLHKLRRQIPLNPAMLK